MPLSGRLPSSEMYPAGEPGVRERFVKLASGLRIRVVESGRLHAPAIVLVPGWGCGAWSFHQTLRTLGDAGFRAIAVELKGHGLSDKPTDAAEYTVEAMRDNVIGILNALSLSTAGLVGHSMGASIAAHVAAVAPDRVTALALVAPVGFDGVMGMRLFRALTPEISKRILPHIATKSVVKLMLYIAYGSLQRPTKRDIEEFYAPTRFPEFSLALRELLHNFNWSKPFPRLAVPYIVIVGSKDHLARPKRAARYAGNRPPVVVAGAAHELFNEAPKVVNDALIDFFRAPAGPGYISKQNEKNSSAQGSKDQVAAS